MLAKQSSQQAWVDAEECYRTRAACFEVYDTQGCGFLEPDYQDCLPMEFGRREIPFQREPLIPLVDKRVALSRSSVPDVTCWSKVVFERETVERLAGEHVAQVLNNPHASGDQLGLLVNFGHFPQLEDRPLVRTDSSIRVDLCDSRAVP